jgi:hypothetical protein
MLLIMGDLVDIATRSAGGIEVALIYDRSEKTLVVFAHDLMTSEEVSIAVQGDEAAEVYRHPFAYAHRGLRRLARRPAPEAARVNTMDAR